MKLTGLLLSVGALAFAASNASAQVQVAKLDAPVMAQDFVFGSSVSLSGDTAIVGEPGDTTVLPQAGSAFLVQRV